VYQCKSKVNISLSNVFLNWMWLLNVFIYIHGSKIFEELHQC
jgi:hypothetical protein